MEQPQPISKVVAKQDMNNNSNKILTRSSSLHQLNITPNLNFNKEMVNSPEKGLCNTTIGRSSTPKNRKNVSIEINNSLDVSQINSDDENKDDIIIESPAKNEIHACKCCHDLKRELESIKAENRLNEI